MAANEKVLERIKKMLTLGNDAGATEAERETALRMAYNVMAKYNLTIADLPSEAKGEDRCQQTFTINADAYARSLFSSVERLFFCKNFYIRLGSAGRDAHYFVGLESNALTAASMAQYLIKSIKREATVRYGKSAGTLARSFGTGTTSSICVRVKEMLANDTEGTPGTALALIKAHQSEEIENTNWLAAMGIAPKPAKPRTNTVLMDAYAEGVVYGRTVPLHKQLD